MRYAGWCVFLLGALVAGPLVAADLVAIEGCTLVPTDWADGDSFRIRTPDGEEHTVRLYGADCLETHVRDETDARRLRSQRRYFGITQVRDTAKPPVGLWLQHGLYPASRHWLGASGDRSRGHVGQQPAGRE